MRDRCNNPKCERYKSYGGRWIKCIWDSFEDFYRDMGESYEKHVKEFGEKQTTLDRIDVNWDYCKENCRWATWAEQMWNLQKNRKWEYKWVKYPSTMALLRWLGVVENFDTIRWRIDSWWDIDKAISTPILLSMSRKKKDGKGI